MTLRRSGPRTRTRWVTLAGGIALMMTLVATAVLAAHPESSLPGSNFELDTDANLKLDDAAPSTDWSVLAHTAGGPEKRATDTATGQDDDSYKGGVKEDTA